MIEHKKKIKLIILFIILGILFIGYGLHINSKPKKREKEIISFLEDKYNTEFKIVKFIKKDINIKEKVECVDDGVCIPERPEIGVYYYLYEVKSTKDNIKFRIKYIDRKFKDEIVEDKEYSVLKKEYDVKKEIKNYIINELERDYIKNIDNYFEINKNFHKLIFDDKYIEKLEEISLNIAYYKSAYPKFLPNINTELYDSKYEEIHYMPYAADIDLKEEFYFKYADNILILLGYSRAYVYTENTKEIYSINYYKDEILINSHKRKCDKIAND